MKQIPKIFYFLFPAILALANAAISQKNIDSAVYRLINEELNSSKYMRVYGVVDRLYTDFSLTPPPPHGYKGFDSTMVNLLVERSHLDHNEREHFINQINQSKTIKWDPALLQKRVIKSEILDSLVKGNNSSIEFVKISSPIYSFNEKTMVLVFEFYHGNKKGYLALIYQKNDNSWIKMTSINE